MLVVASVTPVASSQKLFSKRKQPPASFHDLTKGFAVGEADRRDKNGSLVDASGAYLTSSDAVRGVATPYVPNGTETKDFRTIVNLPGDGPEASGQSRVRAGWKNHTNRLIGLPASVAARRWGLLRPETPSSWKEIIG